MSIELAAYVLTIFDSTMVVKLQQSRKADRIQTHQLDQELVTIVQQLNSTLPDMLNTISIK